jgi:hypothetical protein
MDANTIFIRDNHRPGGVITLEWNGNIQEVVSRLGLNIDSARFQVEYLDSPAPLRDGYYRLVAIKIMAGGNGSSVADFLKQFAMNEWRRLGINFENIAERPKGSRCVGFIICRKNDLLLVASTWIDG